MKSNRQSDRSQAVWPFDLRVFAVVAGLWGLCLALSASIPAIDIDLVDPIETIFAGVRFNGYDARLVLIVEAGIFAADANRICFPHPMGLLSALLYMVARRIGHPRVSFAEFPMSP